MLTAYEKAGYVTHMSLPARMAVRNHYSAASRRKSRVKLPVGYTPISEGTAYADFLADDDWDVLGPVDNVFIQQP